MNVDIKELLDSKRDLSEEEFNKNPELKHLVDGWGFKEIRGKIFIADGWYILSQVALGSRLGDRYLPDPEYFTINFINYIKNATTKILFDKCPLNYSIIADTSIEINTDIIFNDCIENNDVNIIHGYIFKKGIYLNNSNINFTDCTFEDNFKCENINFDVNFSQNRFLKNFVFSALKSCKINFECTQFHSNAFFKAKQQIVSANFYQAKFKNNASFEGIQFGDIIADFSEVEFDKDVSFYRCTFKCETKFNSTVFSGIVKFTGVQFNNVVNLNKVNFKDEAQFYRAKFNRAILTETKFENKANFANAVFSEKAYFTDAVFIREVKLNNILFKNNAYFKNAIFKDFTDFGETNFEKNANFYNADFKKPVNFSSIIFNGALNFVNAKTDFTYEELKKFIEDKSANDIDKCISTTNDFRDGFRLMKHALNNKGNALDASLFHRLELYCKELELEFTLENTKYKNSKNSKEIKSTNEVEAKPKSKNRIELFLDLITLKLYRNTSDHHTNLLKIINFAILTIAMYGLSFLFLDDFLLKAMIDSPKILILLLLVVFLIGLLTCLLYFVVKYKILWATVPIGIFTYIIFITPGLVNAFDYSIYVVIFVLLYVALYALSFYLFRFSFVRFMAYLIFMAIFLDKPVLITPFIGIFTSEKMVESKFEEYIIRYNDNGLDDMLLDANFTNIKAEHRMNFIVKNRKIILERLDNSKTNTPLINFVKKYIKYTKEPMDRKVNCKNLYETTKKSYDMVLDALKYDEVMQSIQKSANLLYIFIVLLVIYSLAKTARRNSVVPS